MLRATAAYTFLTSQKRSETVSFFVSLLTLFDFEMCFAHLRTTMACIFSTSELPKVVREWCDLYILTSTCASRHKGVQLFSSHLARWLRTRRFSEPTFRPSGATNHWKKHNVSRLSYLFAHLHLLSSDSFSSLVFSLTLPISAFHLSILSEV